MDSGTAAADLQTVQLGMILVECHTGMNWSCDQKAWHWQMEVPIVMLGVEQMGCKLAVFHQLFVDYTLAAW